MTTASRPEHFDAVVVGSGFGGSVMAYRFASAGLTVCVLERGKAYPPGSFARGPFDIERNFWDPSEGLHGLFNIWSFRRLEGVVASGLGGGSLIYANVLLRKDEKWFIDEMPGQRGYTTWPITREELDPHYDEVERMIGAQPYPFERAPFDATAKTRAFRAAAQELIGADPRHVSWLLPKLAVTFGVPGEALPMDIHNIHGLQRSACRLCGECDVGCNYGSKNTLDHTYLSQAKRYGADIRTRSEVRTFQPLERGGYAVDYVRHESEGAKLDTGSLPLRRVTCDRLVLAAGTFGTTYLLLKNRQQLPGLNTALLGRRFCGNGDLLTFVLESHKSATRGRTTRPLHASSGPVITSTIRVADEVEGGPGRGFYIQDAGYPEFINWMLQTASMPFSITRAVKFLGRAAARAAGLEADSDLGAELSDLLKATRHSYASMPLLGMGRDVPDGRMHLRGKYLAVDWRILRSWRYFHRLKMASRTIARALDADFAVNPSFWFRRVITVHPLGGAMMAFDPAEGVVNPNGEVFGCKGLYIADGSVMPGPVGANPSLTIAAVADAFATRVLDARRPERRHSMTTPPPAVVSTGEPVTLRFVEEMKGEIWFEPSESPRNEQGSGHLAVRLTIRLEDVSRFLADPEHLGQAFGFVSCDCLGGDLPIERGTFQLFVAPEPGVRLMLYQLHFRDGRGRPLTLRGIKTVRDDPGLDLWRDTTTLECRLYVGHRSEQQENDGPVIGRGEIRIRLRDFIEQLTTFRVTGGTASSRFAAAMAFGRFFMGNLWAIYGWTWRRRAIAAPSPQPGRGGSAMRDIPLYTLTGVPKANISFHPITTDDRLGLNLIRFTRGLPGPQEDAVMIVHGLTTSTDMFIMPEHYNLVSYLLDHGFRDVWCLDYRMSNRFPYNLTAHRFTMDDIALFDYPPAIAEIRRHTAAPLHVIAHCLGSVSFMMSLFGKAVTDVTSVVANSAALTPRVPRWSRVKLQLAPFLVEYVMNAPYINPRWSEDPGLTLGKLFSKTVSLFHRECDVPACHMLSLMWGTGWPALYSHDKLDEITHRRSGDLYGGTAVHYYRHVRAMVRAGGAVKLNPGDPRLAALPDDYFQHAAEIRTPVLLTTGSLNRVFTDSNVVCHRRLEQMAPGRHKLHVFPGYGHQDVFMGNKVHEDVFPTLLAFLESHRGAAAGGAAENKVAV